MRLLSVAALAPVLLTSCDSSNTFDPFQDAVGTYELSVYQGSSVPVTFPCNIGTCGYTNGTFRVNDGTLVLHEDGTFVETNHFTATQTGGGSQNQTYISEGTYEINDDELFLYAPPQNNSAERFIDATFQYGGNDVRINYTENGFSYEYRR
ncbi:MAG: hypothetical protein M3365_11295 [Gemmatimonadota bacterium]|nr:hypothetical protein [Gemmatimonadota bacterium]